MAERMTDGTIRVRSGRILYGNSLVVMEDLQELIELLGKPATKTGTLGFFGEMPETLEGLLHQKDLIDSEISRRNDMLLESRFKTMNGRLFSFRMQKGKDYAELTVGQRIGGPISLGTGAALDLREVEKARKMLGIDPEQPEGIWLVACVEAMRGIARLERHLGSSKLFLRQNRKAGKSKFRIGKPKANYPRGKK